MPRPPKKRFIGHISDIAVFLPIRKGEHTPEKILEEGIRVTASELEVLRLKHHLGVSQTEGAARMKISQSTFSRILDTAHIKITRALVEGKPIAIGGGVFHKIFRGFGCPECNHEWETEDTSDSRGAGRCPRCNFDHPYHLNK